MEGVSALAARIFEKSGKGAAPGAGAAPAPKGRGEDMSPEAVAGRRFAEAVKGGDGAAVAAAYRELKEACMSADDDGELTTDTDGAAPY